MIRKNMLDDEKKRQSAMEAIAKATTGATGPRSVAEDDQRAKMKDAGTRALEANHEKTGESAKNADGKRGTIEDDRRIAELSAEKAEITEKEKWNGMGEATPIVDGRREKTQNRRNRNTKSKHQRKGQESTKKNTTTRWNTIETRSRRKEG